MSLADIHDKQETATMKAQSSPSTAVKAATSSAGGATSTAQKSAVASGVKVASGSSAAPVNNNVSATKQSNPAPASSSSGSKSSASSGTKSSNPKADSVGSGANYDKLQNALGTVTSNPSAAVRAGRADAVDLSGKLSFSLLQDLLDTATPAAAKRSVSNGFAQSDNPGSDFGTWEEFVKNVQNRSLGSPRGAGYGLDAAPGAASSSGGIDVLGSIHDFLQAPYNKRVEKNGGKAPFEGVVDWSGIGTALVDNAHKNEAARRGTATPLSTTGAFDSVDTAGPNWGNLLDLTSGAFDNTDVPDRLPPGVPLDASAYPGVSSFAGEDRNQQIDGYSPALAGIDAATTRGPTAAEQAALDRVFGGVNSDVFATDGQVSTPDGTVITPGSPLKPGYNGGVTGPMKSEEPSTWDKVVDNSGKLLSHTGLGTIVSKLFPDIWNGGGDMMKSLDNGGHSGGGIDNVAFTDLINGGHGSDPFFTHDNGGSNSGDGGGSAVPVVPGTPGFPDVNHNGIDDRLETGAYGPNSLDTLANRYAVFPNMPPYKPGVDDEWTYFRSHLARGGVVGYADGGAVSPLAEADPRVMMIADAEDALHNAVNGTPEPDDGPAIQKFVKAFGQDALEQLKQNVTGGMKMRPGQKQGRTVVGPGGPTDDAVPAVIDGQHPAALSSGEFVMSNAAVAGAGDGDPAVGAKRLQQLHEQLAQKAA